MRICESIFVRIRVFIMNYYAHYGNICTNNFSLISINIYAHS